MIWLQKCSACTLIGEYVCLQDIWLIFGIFTIITCIKAFVVCVSYQTYNNLSCKELFTVLYLDAKEICTDKNTCDTWYSYSTARCLVCVTHLQHSCKSLTLIKRIVQHPNGSSDIVQEYDRNRHSLRVQIIRRLVATMS